MVRRTTSLGVVVLALAGCNHDAGGGSPFDAGEGGTASVPTTAGSDDGIGTTAASTGDDAGDTGSTGDPGVSSSGGGSSGGEPTEPCTTLDVLVVIDDSDAMADEQAKLTAALPAFMTAVDAALPGVMHAIHLGVITTDDAGLVVETATACGFASGAHWMGMGEALATEIACASAVGVAGDPDERPMQRAIEAISGDLVQPDAWNAGFLQSGGPLVLVVVTDEEDDLEPLTEWGSPGDPPDWVEAIAASKGGYVQNVVALSLVGIDAPNACPGPWDGSEGAEPAPRLRAFTESFPHHAVGDACAAEYGTFFTAAVAEVTAACAAHVPE